MQRELVLLHRELRQPDRLLYYVSDGDTYAHADGHPHIDTYAHPHIDTYAHVHIDADGYADAHPTRLGRRVREWNAMRLDLLRAWWGVL
jgi:hypothetical protein